LFQQNGDTVFQWVNKSTLDQTFAVWLESTNRWLKSTNQNSIDRWFHIVGRHHMYRRATAAAMRVIDAHEIIT